MRALENDVARACLMNSVRSRDAQWQWARTSLRALYLSHGHCFGNNLISSVIGHEKKTECSLSRRLSKRISASVENNEIKSQRKYLNYGLKKRCEQDTIGFCSSSD